MTLTPTQRGEGRAALLHAALEELEENGVANLSLRAIARRAGVSHAAPKYHFSDRSGLLTAVALDGFTRLNVALADAVAAAGSDARAQFAAGGRAYVEFGLNNAALFVLMFRVEQLDLTNAELLQQKNAAFGSLDRIVRNGTESAAFTAGQPAEVLALISWAFLHGLVVLAHDGALELMTGESGTAALAASLTAAFADTISAR